ncbi:MAG: undecaprenyl-diphosphate phosphatase [Acidobacteriota bacterium]
MSIWEAIFLGAIEGLTEFLPISSTFHLSVFSQLVGRGEGEFAKLFAVVIQSGAILAVVVLTWQKHVGDFRLIKRMLAAFVPTAILGFLLYRLVKNVLLESYSWMAGIFILVGVAFFIFEGLVKKGILNPSQGLARLTYGHAVVIGLAQTLAFLPGVSRAGAVILAMMVLGYSRKDAAVFSFLLAVPTIFSAGAYDLYRTRELMSHSGSEWLLLAAGTAVAFFVAYVTLRWFIRFLQTHTLKLFGFYRLVVGSLLTLLLLLT